MPSFQTQSRKTIDEAFAEFHANNPEIYSLLKKQIERALKGGKKKLSVKQIIGWIRWEYFIQTTDTAGTMFGGKEKQSFKINDAYTSRYARLLVKDFPAYEQNGIIEMRELRS